MEKSPSLTSVVFVDPVHRLNSDSSEQLGNTDDLKAKSEAELRGYRQLRSDHKELIDLQKETLAENRDLLEKVARMTENLKKMKYEDAMESKANITTNKLNRYLTVMSEISAKLKVVLKLSTKRVKPRKTCSKNRE
jgi:hypothetical protein